MNINCLIIDDEPAAIRVIEKFLNEFTGFTIVEKCKSAFQAIEIIKSQKIDLMFLDINMPGISGLELIKAIDNPPLTIITTAYREYALESFELRVLDYLHKPFSLERFTKAIARANEYFIKEKLAISSGDFNINNITNFFFIKSDSILHKVNFNGILYVESVGDYCKIVLQNKSIVSHITLKKTLSLLPDQFMRIHKSYIINIDHIISITGNEVKVGNETIPIGYTYKKQLQDIIGSL